MSVSAHDVARELRERLPGVGVAKLHKLLYYAQGWHLVAYGAPLFREEINAWANGPVVAELWADEQHDRGRPPGQPLDGTALAAIDYVVDRYGRCSGRELIAMTHDEQPWRAIGESDDPRALDNPVIAHDSLRSWFEREAEWRAHVAEVERLRQRSDVFSFAQPSNSPDLDAAVARARRGERVRHRRPR